MFTMNAKKTVFTLLCMLCGLITLGCSESVEENDATVLKPDEDINFRFQNLIVGEGGSLIPPDEISVITIEKTREDAENVWWQLKADPVPQHEDLVVGVFFQITRTIEIDDDATDLVPVWIRQNEWLTETFPLFHLTEDAFPIFAGDYYYYYLVSILKSQNKSIEVRTPRLPANIDIDEKTIELDSLKLYVSDLQYTLFDVLPSLLVTHTHGIVVPHAVASTPLPWVPAFRLSDGYVVPQGFQFFYYGIGESGMLEISNNPPEPE